MSTSSSPATAESSTSRRGFLVKGAAIAASFASAAGTASVLGVGAASAAATQPLALSASGADEALFALLAEWTDLSKQNEAAFWEVQAASDRCDALAPSVPKVAARDRQLGLSQLDAGDLFDNRAIGYLQRIIEIGHTPGDNDPPFAKAYQARIRQIVAEWQAYLAADDAAREASGLNAAEREADRVSVIVRRLFNRIAKTPAQTAAGALAKIAAVADYFNDAVIGEESMADDVLHSAVCDVERLGLGRLPAEVLRVSADARA